MSRGKWTRHLLSLALFAQVLSSIGVETPVRKAVSVGIHTQWACVPLHLEISEWIEEVGGSFLFWEVLEDTAEKGLSSPGFLSSDQAQHDWMIAQIRRRIGDSLSRVARWVAATRSLSPRVEFHASVGDELVYGQESLKREQPFLLFVPPSEAEDGLIFSSLKDLENYVAGQESSKPEMTVSRDLAEGIESDHRYPTTCSRDAQIPHAVLHADFGRESFHAWHSSLKALSKQCKIVYFLRHWFPPCESGSAYLQGYTVEATLRNTEYLVVDDRQPNSALVAAAQNFSLAKTDMRSVGGLLISANDKDNLSDKLNTFAIRAQEGVLGAPMRADMLVGQFFPWEKRDAGVIAASWILSSQDPLLAFQELAEDFPAYDLYSSSDMDLQADLKRAAGEAREKLRGDNVAATEGLWLNGRKIDPTKPNELLECITEIETLGSALHQINIPDIRAILTTTPRINVGSFRVNISALRPPVTYFNDLEKDSRYESWSSDYSTLVDTYLSGRPLMRLANLKKNLLNFIAVIEPSDPRQLAVVSLGDQITSGMLPLRFGIIPLAGETGSASEALAGAIFFFLQRKDFEELGAFVEELLQSNDDQAPISKPSVERVFNGIAETSLQSVLEDLSIQEHLDQARRWAADAGFGADKEAPLLDLNGIEIHDIGRQVMGVCAKEHTRIAELVKAGELAGDEHIEGAAAVGRGLNFVPNLSKDVLDYSTSRIPLATALASNRAVYQEFRGLSYISVDQEANITVWVVGNFELVSAQSLAHKSLTWFGSLEPERARDVRLSFLCLTNSEYNPSLFITDLADLSYQEKASALAQKVGTKADAQERASSQSLLAAIGAHEESIIVNGRLIKSSEFKSPETLDLYVAVEQAIETRTEESELSKETNADQRLVSSSSVVRLSSACEDKEKSTHDVTKIQAMLAESPLSYRAPSVESHLDINAVVDPMNRRAAEISRLLTFFRDDFGAAVSLILLPAVASRAAPTIYRKLVLKGRLGFDEKGSLMRDDLPQARFERLPHTQIITISTSTPRSWLIGSSKCIHDLDNIILDKVREPVLRAEYKLESLLVEGSCTDESRNHEPPQGLKVELQRAPPKETETSDTLVMQNVGYFQLKASSPGRWFIRLAHGRSREIFSVQKFYEMGKHRYTAKEVEDTGNVYAAVDNLNGIMKAYLVVKRNEGHHSTQLLDPESRVALNDQSTVHIFSVASGHLYERFMRIMILSVLKNTKAPVKFWMLGNYLSPAFKTILPGFSSKYGFEYEFVTYQWPGWLREQTEKQRIIWAYKILFLDVLFPLSVPRIIFVDADQVVRGDISELYQIDLDGAPYGYVPFCDSRKEVEGYRFWRGGFWESHLDGNPYHISALYVVDLHLFREGAAGDTLRAQYQSLSADPNSLSNLDQDLPNFVGSPRLGPRGVRIFSLPSKWLWCESWCDDESKEEAQVIDLCNNPMTREPKLQSARRIVGEWGALDDEASVAVLEVYSSLSGPATDEVALDEGSGSDSEAGEEGNTDHEEL